MRIVPGFQIGQKPLLLYDVAFIIILRIINEPVEKHPGKLLDISRVDIFNNYRFLYQD